MKLSDLPPELLRGILNGCGDVIALWKAGDHTLNAKLVNNGVTEVELATKRFDSSSRWPQCLKSFRLERLFISCRNPSFCAPGLLHELQQLHSGLRVLQLYIPGLLELILPIEGESNVVEFNALSNSFDHSSATKRFKNADSAQETAIHTMLWNLEHTWPSLERLDLGPNIQPSTPFSLLVTKHDPQILTLLPQRLTCLRLPYSEIHPLPGMLPPGLKTLHLAALSLTTDDLRHLPKSITDIMLSVNEYGLALLNQERDLLPNLKQFPIIDLDERGLNILELTESIRSLSWPPNMLEAIYYAIDDSPSIYEDLPSAMTSFTVRTYDETPLLQSSAIHRLPRGLTSLSIPELEWADIDVSTWPTTLIDLTVHHGSTFGTDCFYLLPRNLQSFSIHEEYETEEGEEEGDFEDDDERDFPEGENHLLHGDFDILCTVGRESLSIDTHWISIKQLILKKVSSVHGMAAETYIEKVESGQLYGLPLTLTSLALTRQFLPMQGSLLLPPRLSHFECESKNGESTELILARPVF